MDEALSFRYNNQERIGCSSWIRHQLSIIHASSAAASDLKKDYYFDISRHLLYYLRVVYIYMYVVMQLIGTLIYISSWPFKAFRPIKR